MQVIGAALFVVCLVVLVDRLAKDYKEFHPGSESDTSDAPSQRDRDPGPTKR